MSMEIFEKITNAMMCENCPREHKWCGINTTCGDAILVLIKKDNEEKGIETNEN